MTKILSALKIGWVIGQAAGWALFGCALVSVAGEPFRVEPRPMDPALLPPPVELPVDPPEAAQQDATPAVPHDAVNDAAGARPVVYVHSTPGCQPCNFLWQRIRAGEFPEFQFEERPPEQWMQFVPTLTFEAMDGKTYRFDWWSVNTRDAPAEFRAAWRRRNPGVELPPLAYGAVTGGASPFDQVQKFTGPGGSFTFKPDAPINASLDDRTSIKYPSIQGRYTVENGVVRLKLEAPLPVGNYRRFLNFGFQITGAVGPENVTPTTADVTIETNRGPQKVTIQMEPVK